MKLFSESGRLVTTIMSRNRLSLFGATAILVGGIMTAPASAGPKPVNFTREIKPILKAKCYSCHDSTNAKGDLDLTTKAAILKGGSEGKLYKAGKGADSLFVKRLKGQGGAIMPKGDSPLTATQIKLVTRWINEGGKF